MHKLWASVFAGEVLQILKKTNHHVGGSESRIQIPDAEPASIKIEIEAVVGAPNWMAIKINVRGSHLRRTCCKLILKVTHLIKSFQIVEWNLGQVIITNFWLFEHWESWKDWSDIFLVLNKHFLFSYMWDCIFGKSFYLSVKRLLFKTAFRRFFFLPIDDSRHVCSVWQKSIRSANRGSRTKAESNWSARTVAARWPNPLSTISPTDAPHPRMNKSHNVNLQIFWIGSFKCPPLILHRTDISWAKIFL